MAFDFLYFILQGACQRQALAARAGIGGKNPKVEPAFGAESLEGRAAPALVRLHAMLALRIWRNPAPAWKKPGSERFKNGWQSAKDEQTLE